MPIIDVHAHYVSPDVLAEVERNGKAYGVKAKRIYKDQTALLIGNTAPLRPIFSELASLTLRLPALARHGINRQVIST